MTSGGPSSTEAARSYRGPILVGLTWMISQSLVAKLLSMAGQVALAYLLAPEHFAWISLSYTVIAFACVLENGGLREVLVQRGGAFDYWAGAAFSLSLGLGLVSGLVVILAAPVAAYAYKSTEIQSLLTWLAINPLVIALATVPVAKLQVEHRFRTLAGLTALQTCSQVIATVSLAWLGFGAHSFVFGTLVASVVFCGSVWVAATPATKRVLSLEKWKALWSDTLSLSLVGLTTALSQQIGYVMLGFFQPVVSVGHYYFAFSLASQLSQVVASNIAAVILPVLSKMSVDAKRQLAASVKALQIFAGVGIPLSFLQCGLTDAGFRLLLPAKWFPAIAYAEVLSIGLGLNLVSSLCWSLLKARGQFRSLLYFNAIGALIQTALVTFAASSGTPLSVAWVVTGYCCAYAPAMIWFSIYKIGGSWREVLAILAIPCAGSAAALLAAWQLEGFIPSSTWELPIRLAVVAFVFTGIYCTVLIVTKHLAVSEVSKYVAEKLRRRRTPSGP